MFSTFLATVGLLIAATPEATHVLWHLGEAGATCTEVCGDLGSVCANSYWPRDALEIARIAFSTHTNCANIERASSNVYLPSFAPGGGKDTCFYSGDGAARADPCNDGPHSVEVSGHRPFCPCKATTDARLFSEGTWIPDHANFNSAWMAAIFMAMVAGGAVGCFIAMRVGHARYS